MNYIRSFNEVGIKDIPLVGGKNASLGEMYQALRPKGVRIPEGFIINADAFTRLFKDQRLSDAIYGRLDSLDTRDVAQLEKTGREVRELIHSNGLPTDIKTDIRNAYTELCQLVGIEDVDVAVRSSATAEDLPETSFAG